MKRKQIVIYLAGNIQKGHEKTSGLFWTQKDRAFLSETLSPTEVAFLNPAHRTDDLSDQKSVFGRDMTQIFCSHFVLVDARERRGLGVGAEMMWAKINKIPVLALAPPETHYRKSHTELLGVGVKDWIHPFVESLSDHVVTNLQEAADWISSYFAGEIEQIKGTDFLHEAMDHYKTHQFCRDLPMQELAKMCESLQISIARV